MIVDELKLSFIQVAQPSEQVGMLIRLEDVEELNELLTASAEGTPLERELILRANVSWVDMRRDVLDENSETPQVSNIIEPESFRLRRSFAYDDQAILAKEREADFLMMELERDLARRIVIRLRQLDQ